MSRRLLIGDAFPAFRRTVLIAIVNDGCFSWVAIGPKLLRRRADEIGQNCLTFIMRKALNLAQSGRV